MIAHTTIDARLAELLRLFVKAAQKTCWPEDEIRSVVEECMVSDFESACDLLRSLCQV